MALWRKSISLWPNSGLQAGAWGFSGEHTPPDAPSSWACALHYQGWRRRCRAALIFDAYV